MSKLKNVIKKSFPVTFEWYKHIKRIQSIYEIERKKKMTTEQHREWISNQYKKRIGCDMVWDNPTTYTEKMQWTKLYDNNPMRAMCADKYMVRKWVIDKIGEEYLIPLLGVWNKFEDINFKDARIRSIHIIKRMLVFLALKNKEKVAILFLKLINQLLKINLLKPIAQRKQHNYLK